MNKAALASGGRIDIHRRVFPDFYICICICIWEMWLAVCLGPMRSSDE